jgi:hypothetical protein
VFGYSEGPMLSYLSTLGLWLSRASYVSFLSVRVLRVLDFGRVHFDDNSVRAGCLRNWCSGVYTFCAYTAATSRACEIPNALGGCSIHSLTAKCRNYCCRPRGRWLTVPPSPLRAGR